MGLIHSLFVPIHTFSLSFASFAGMPTKTNRSKYDFIFLLQPLFTVCLAHTLLFASLPLVLLRSLCCCFFYCYYFFFLLFFGLDTKSCICVNNTWHRNRYQFVSCGERIIIIMPKDDSLIHIARQW